MTDDRPQPTAEDRAAAMRTALAAAGLAGVEVSEFGRDLLDRMVRGEITSEQAREAARKRYGKGAARPAD